MGTWLVLRSAAMAGGHWGEKAREEPGHAATESRYAGAENANVQFDITPECGNRAFISYVFSDGDRVEPD